MTEQTDPSLAVACRTCEARIGNPCKERGRKQKYSHGLRHIDWRAGELDRRRIIREDYLAKWILAYGHIFKLE